MCHFIVSGQWREVNNSWGLKLKLMSLFDNLTGSCWGQPYHMIWTNSLNVKGVALHRWTVSANPLYLFWDFWPNPRFSINLFCLKARWRFEPNQHVTYIQFQSSISGIHKVPQGWTKPWDRSFFKKLSTKSSFSSSCIGAYFQNWVKILRLPHSTSQILRDSRI